MNKTVLGSTLALGIATAVFLGVSTYPGHSLPDIDATDPEASEVLLSREFNFAAGCRDTLDKPDMVYDVNFWSDVVGQEQYTLIGDTDHKNPHLLSILENDEILRAWAREGVTDIYIEARPYLQDDVDAFLGQPEARENIAAIFRAYYDEFNLYDVGEWKDIRADYQAGLIVKAHEHGMKVHLFSPAPTLFEDNPRQAQIYALKTQYNMANCGQMRFFEFAEELMANGFSAKELVESRDIFPKIYRERLEQDAVHARYMRENNNGGKAVVMIGSAHLSYGHDIDVPNLRAHLGYENTTLVEIYQHDYQLSESYPDAAKYDAQSYRYSLASGKSFSFQP